MMNMTPTGQSSRERILNAAVALLAEGGREAVTTRAVSTAAGVQAPTIYRQFGDIAGLFDAVITAGFSGYLEVKAAREPSGDPVEDLRQGWDLHVGFGLANPATYRLMYGEARPDKRPTAAGEVDRILRGLVEGIAEAGRLAVGVERAGRMINAACVGVVLTLIATAKEDRDPTLSATMRELIIAAVTTAEAHPSERGDSSGGGQVATRAVSLKAVLPQAERRLTPGERHILSEWLDRLSDVPD